MKWLQQWFHSEQRTQKRASFRPLVEGLEVRLCMSSSQALPSLAVLAKPALPAATASVITHSQAKEVGGKTAIPQTANPAQATDHLRTGLPQDAKLAARDLALGGAALQRLGEPPTYPFPFLPASTTPFEHLQVPNGKQSARDALSGLNKLPEPLRIGPTHLVDSSGSNVDVSPPAPNSPTGNATREYLVRDSHGNWTVWDQQHHDSFVRQRDFANDRRRLESLREDYGRLVDQANWMIRAFGPENLPAAASALAHLIAGDIAALEMGWELGHVRLPGEVRNSDHPHQPFDAIFEDDGAGGYRRRNERAQGHAYHEKPPGKSGPEGFTSLSSAVLGSRDTTPAQRLLGSGTDTNQPHRDNQSSGSTSGSSNSGGSNSGGSTQQQRTQSGSGAEHDTSGRADRSTSNSGGGGGDGGDGGGGGASDTGWHQDTMGDLLDDTWHRTTTELPPDDGSNRGGNDVGPRNMPKPMKQQGSGFAQARIPKTPLGGGTAGPDDSEEPQVKVSGNAAGQPRPGTEGTPSVDDVGPRGMPKSRGGRGVAGESPMVHMWWAVNGPKAQPPK